MREFNYEEVIEQFEEITKDAGGAQRETLRKILDENGGVEYLQSFGLHWRTDPESFRACVPLIDHPALEPYIRRIADGDTSPILTAKPITSFSVSSGTTQGKPKLLPFNEELMQNTAQIYKISFAFRNREFPIGHGKSLQFIYGSKLSHTGGGLIATTATTNVFRSEKFKHLVKDIQSQSCSPDEVIFSPDFEQSLYCHFLCGLVCSNEVQFISSTFAHSIVNAFRTFENIWKELCDDIKYGLLSKNITNPSIRDAMSKILHPDPDLAESIRRKCAGLSNWYGVIPELWPNAKYVYGIMTGSMEPYAKKLRHYAGSLPLICHDYGASEGWIAANVSPNLGPEEATFAVVPDIGYFEFIPLSKSDDEQAIDSGDLKTVGLTEVEVGKEYEMVITTFAGLYRYRMGDMVKVAGFHNTTPKLQFVRRQSLILNINIDKNTEKDLQLAVEEASNLLAADKLEVIDFTSHANISGEPGHYVIYWELNGDASDELMSSCCDCLDRAFVDAGYVVSRKVKAIGPLELRVVHKGTFRKLLEHYIGMGGAVSQFKTPRCVVQSNNQVLELLSDNVVKSYFSNAYV